MIPQRPWFYQIEKSVPSRSVPQDHFAALNRNRETSKPGVWIPLSLWNWDRGNAAFRTVAWNEVLVDFEGNWAKVYDSASRVRDFLRSYNIPHYLFLTGGRGVHISIFLDAQPFDLDWRDIRIGVAKWIQEGSRSEFDYACISDWTDETRGHLVR